MSQAGRGGWGRVVVAVARHPSLWTTALTQSVRLAPPGWWRRPPFSPRPPTGYLAFRQLTATGSSAGPPAPEDVLSWLTWARDWRRRGL